MANIVEVVLQAKDQASGVIDKTSVSLKKLDNTASSAASSIDNSIDPFEKLKSELLAIGPSADVAGTSIESTAVSSRLLGAALNPVALGIAAVVAALGGYVALLYAGEKQNFEFAKAVTLSGNAAGVTAGELQALAHDVGDAVGGMSGATEVLTAMASGGRIAGDNLAYLASVALQLKRNVGIPVEQTVQIFEQLGKEPLKASQQLNEQYGYLTKSVEDQIKKLQDLGQYSEAASVAQKAFADAQQSNLDALTGQLGTFQKAVLSVKDAWVSLKNAVLDIGREALPEARLKELQQARGSRALFSGTSRQSASTFSAADNEEVKLTQMVLQAQQDARDKAEVTRSNKERTADEKRIEEAKKRQQKWQEVQDSLQEVNITSKKIVDVNPWIQFYEDINSMNNQTNESFQDLFNNFSKFADDAFKGVPTSFKESTSKTLEMQQALSETMKGIWQGVGQSIQSSLADAFYNGSLSISSFMDILRRAVAEIASAAILGKLKELFTTMSDSSGGSSSSSGWGAVFSGLVKAFSAGGGRTDGPTVVGESGPEVVVPSGSGMRTFNARQLAFAGGGGSVNFAPSYNIGIQGARNDDEIYENVVKFVNQKSSRDQQEFMRTLERNGYGKLR